MSKITDELNEALNLVSMISVSGDAVDVMALAKQKIRFSIAEIEAAEQNNAKDRETTSEG